jgi:hypothetical protein
MGGTVRRQLALALAVAAVGHSAPALAQTPAHKFGRGAANPTCGIRAILDPAYPWDLFE